MVAEGEDWKSVEIPAADGNVTSSNVVDETEESEEPSGGKSTVKSL